LGSNAKNAYLFGSQNEVKVLPAQNVLEGKDLNSLCVSQYYGTQNN